MSTPIASEKDQWIGSTTAARMVGIDERTMAKAAVSAGIRRKRVPGVRGVRYYREDVLKLVRDCIEGGTDSEPQTENTMSESSRERHQKNRAARTRP